MPRHQKHDFSFTCNAQVYTFSENTFQRIVHPIANTQNHASPLPTTYFVFWQYLLRGVVLLSPSKARRPTAHVQTSFATNHACPSLSDYFRFSNIHKLFQIKPQKKITVSYWTPPILVSAHISHFSFRHSICAQNTN